MPPTLPWSRPPPPDHVTGVVRVCITMARRVGTHHHHHVLRQCRPTPTLALNCRKAATWLAPSHYTIQRPASRAHTCAHIHTHTSPTAYSCSRLQLTGCLACTARTASCSFAHVDASKSSGRAGLAVGREDGAGRGWGWGRGESVCTDRWGMCLPCVLCVTWLTERVPPAGSAVMKGSSWLVVVPQ